MISVQKYAVLPAFILIALFIVTVSTVFAEDNTQVGGYMMGTGGYDTHNMMWNASSSMPTMPPMIMHQDTEQDKGSAQMATGLSINGQGNVMIQNAKVSSLSGQNMMLSVFGIPLTIMDVASSTQIIGVADFAHITVGDMVSVRGTIDQTSGVVTAMQIRDMSQQQQLIASLYQQIQALLAQIKALQGQVHNQ